MIRCTVERDIFRGANFHENLVMLLRSNFHGSTFHGDSIGDDAFLAESLKGIVARYKR